MKWSVSMYQGGKTFIVEVYAPNPRAARQTAENLNPYSKVVGVNASFK